MAGSNGGASRYDAVVIGAGHNGLVTAAYLARGGMRTLVLERRERRRWRRRQRPSSRRARACRPWPTTSAGCARRSGATSTSRATACASSSPQVLCFAPSPDGTAVHAVGRRQTRPPRGSASARRTMASAYVEFDRQVRSIGRFLAELAARTPPDIEAPGLGDALLGLTLGRRFRGLGRHDGRTVLRVLPMAVADFVAEAFETDALQAALAWRGVAYTAMGPWSAGTAAVLLGDSAGNDGGAAGPTVYAEGGPGALTTALAAAARAAGAEIRTGAEVVGGHTHATAGRPVSCWRVATRSRHTPWSARSIRSGR